MRRKIASSGVIAAIAFLALTADASAGNVNFVLGGSNTALNLDTNATVSTNGYQSGTGILQFNDGAPDFAPVNAQAFEYSANTWSATHLYIRNNPSDDVGLGVCSTGEPNSPCSGNGTNGGGDYNELSNEGLQELVQLSLPFTNEHWISITLSSLDSGGDPIERGILFGADASIAGSSDSIAALLSSSLDRYEFEYGDNGTSVNATLNLASLGGIDFTDYRYLYLVAYDHSGNGGTNNDYLIGSAVVDYPVPEPATMTLLAMGLAGFGWVRRRQKARA